MFRQTNSWRRSEIAFRNIQNEIRLWQCVAFCGGRVAIAPCFNQFILWWQHWSKRSQKKERGRDRERCRAYSDLWRWPPYPARLKCAKIQSQSVWAESCLDLRLAWSLAERCPKNTAQQNSRHELRVFECRELRNHYFLVIICDRKFKKKKTVTRQQRKRFHTPIRWTQLDSLVFMIVLSTKLKLRLYSF